jgi:hypothetical protein
MQVWLLTPAVDTWLWVIEFICMVVWSRNEMYARLLCTHHACDSNLGKDG